MSQELIFLVNTFATFFLTGLIWTVQRVHYPAFRMVNKDNYPEFQKHHMHNIGLIVIPLMVLEITTSFSLFWVDGFTSLNAIGFYLVLLIWISTGLFSVPAHAKLERGKNEEAIQQLVLTNWIRTVLWTLKSGLNFYMLVKLVPF